MSVAELFRRNPLKHTQEDLTTIVEFLRKNRPDMRQAAPTKTGKAKAAAKPGSISKEELADLLKDI